MSKRKDKTFAQQLDERISTMESKLKNLVTAMDDGHTPADGEQALRVAALMQDVSARLHRLGSSA